MLDARTHDIITVASGALFALAVYVLRRSVGRDDAAVGAAVLTCAHVVSGLFFSSDLAVDSSIDRRWGRLSWIWRPYMWLIPRHHSWRHSLVFAPLLRLVSCILVMLPIMIGGAYVVQGIGVRMADPHVPITVQLVDMIRRNPDVARMGVIGFISGSAVHTLADYLVIERRRHMRMVGIRMRRNRRNRDRG